MLENDYLNVMKSLEEIGSRHSYEDGNGQSFNPYANKKRAQTKCKHMWPNDTDAIYIGPNGKRKCAICGKEF